MSYGDRMPLRIVGSRNERLYPYAGTSGWMGSETSRQRALLDDSAQLPEKRHELTIEYMHTVGSYGTTWFELADALGWHHGKVSAALTRAHRINAIARLTETRGHGRKSKVYVLVEHVDGRKTEPYKPRPRMQLLRDVRSCLEAGDIQEAIALLDDVLSPPTTPRRRLIIIPNPR